MGSNNKSTNEILIKKYKEGVDTLILEFVKDVLDGKRDDSITVGFVNDKAAMTIENLTGKSVHGNRIELDANGVKHIINRHGKNGKQDHSMKEIEDIARMGYVLANYDLIEFHNEYAQGYRDKDGKMSPKIIISKKIDGTFYIIEAVSDSKTKKNHIISAYIKKKPPGPDNALCPRFTSKT